MAESIQLPRIRAVSTVRDEVIGALTGAIERGELLPGTQLPPERDLAAMLGVSRSATRDALKTLAGAGVLHIRHGHGTFVAQRSDSPGVGIDVDVQLGTSQLTDLFEMRLVLEGQSAQWAAERLTGRMRLQLTQVIETINQVDSSTTLEALRDLDRLFHGKIAEATGNQTLMKLMNSLLEQLVNASSLSLQLPGRALRSVAEHKMIGAAILAGDSAEARRLMQDHIQSVENNLRDALGIRPGSQIKPVDDGR